MTKHEKKETKQRTTKSGQKFTQNDIEQIRKDARNLSRGDLAADIAEEATEAITPQSETPTADMPKPKTCPYAGCNAVVVDKGGGNLECRGPRRHKFVDTVEESAKPKKIIEEPEPPTGPTCPFAGCFATFVEIVDKKTGAISYKCRGRSRHMWEK